MTEFRVINRKDGAVWMTYATKELAQEYADRVYTKHGTHLVVEMVLLVHDVKEVKKKLQKDIP